MIAMIKSGGQTGVDIAALRAAKRVGIPTGGMMPHGFRTLVGSRPEWAREFGLAEHQRYTYPPRTYENVRDSDITIRIALNFRSAGEICTENAIARYKRPSFDVHVDGLLPPRSSLARMLSQSSRTVPISSSTTGWQLTVPGGYVVGAAAAIRQVHAAIDRAVVVNFAGNSERTAPGIETVAEAAVLAIIAACAGGAR